MRGVIVPVVVLASVCLLGQARDPAETERWRRLASLVDKLLLYEGK